MTSSRCERCSPITCIALPQQQRQAVSSGSTTISTRGGQVFRHHRNEIGRDKAGVGNPG